MGDKVARWSGSASNRQPWEFVLIRSRETLQALAALEGYAHHLASAALEIVLVMASEQGQVEQETYDEGRLSERIMLAAAAYDVGSKTLAGLQEVRADRESAAAARQHPRRDTVD